MRPLVRSYSLFDAVLTIWMLASSVVYPVGIVGGRLGEVMSWNPMAVIIDAYRALVFSGTLPPVNAWQAARYTLPGVYALESARKDGERLRIDDFGDAPTP